jgi:hypothetical protein
MSVSRVRISGILPYATARVPGPERGFPFVAPSSPPLILPKTADRFVREMGGTRDIFWSLAGVSLGFHPMGPARPADILIPPIEINFRTTTFKTCAAVEEHLSQLVKDGKAIAKATLGFKKPVLLNGKTDKIDKVEFHHKVDAFIALDLKKVSISFPDFRWKPMSVRDREALRGFYLNLMVHELGHFIVAGQVLAYAKQTFEGFGSSEARAERNARDTLNSHLTELEGDLKRISDEYDLHTKHGVEQSEGPSNNFNAERRKSIPFPGGNNVILHLRCN